MTDLNNDVTSDSIDAFQADDASVSTESTNEAAVTESAPVTEKLIPQSQVNRIVSARLKEQAAQQERLKAQAQQATPQPLSYEQQTGQAGLSEAQLRQIIQQEAAKLAHIDKANSIAKSYTGKINEAMNSDPEFAELYSDLNIEEHPELVLLVNELDNTAAVIKDIAKNPAKFSNVLMLASAGKIGLAKKALSGLSNSIKTNEAAKKQEIAPAPLSQMKPSHLSAGDGRMTVRDFKSQFRG
jgi:hypothetical protein